MLRSFGLVPCILRDIMLQQIPRPDYDELILDY